MANWEWFTRLHRAVYAGSGGRVGSKLMGVQMLLLTTTGRKSGLERSIPLACFPDGDDLVVVGSNNGQDHDPAWLLNLSERPRALVRLGREKRHVDAHVALREERERLWPWLVKQNPMYAKYEKKTARTIPVVVLRRAEET